MRRLLFKIARSPIAGWFIGFAFARLTMLMPLNRLYEDAHGILFLHPKPYWQTHWLGVPKRSIASFAALDWGREGELVVGIVTQLMRLAQPLDGHKAIVVNGGAYQDVPQLHFHLAHGGLVDGGAWDDVDFQSVELIDETENSITIHKIGVAHWQLSAAPTLAALIEVAHSFINRKQFTTYTLQIHWNDEPFESVLVAHIFTKKSTN